MDVGYFTSFKHHIYLSISYAHVKENKKTLKIFVCLGHFWMLGISFIQIIITHVIFTCEGNQKKHPFWMLDISFIQIICTCGGNKIYLFSMSDISSIQIIDTRIICTCKGNKKGIYIYIYIYIRGPSMRLSPFIK